MEKPCASYPAHLAINTELNLIIDWTCSDPDDDSLRYDIYLDTVHPPLESLFLGQINTKCEVSDLKPDLKYYWKVVAKDGKDSTESDIWSFTTRKRILMQNTESWVLKGFSIGETPGNETSAGSFIMADVMQTDSGYRMFYTVSRPDGADIKYAESMDGDSWEVKGTVLQGAEEENDREYIIGGPDIVKLPDGKYRMYYRASPKFHTDPQYHVRTALSDDGINFIRERITIDIYPDDPNSTLTLAGHGTYFIAGDGTYVAIFSGNYLNDDTPSDLVISTSIDGLNWSGFRTIYYDWHDPIVVKKDGQYILYANYLKDYQGKAVSPDGLNWPAQMDSLILIDSQENVLSPLTDGLGDMGAVVTIDNQLRLFTNYGVPSRNIACFELKEQETPVQQVIQNPGIFTDMTIHPNPASSFIWVSLNHNTGKKLKLEIYNINGEKVINGTIVDTKQMNLNHLSSGIYFVHIFNGSSINICKKFVLVK